MRGEEVMKTLSVVLLVISGAAFADHQYTQKELTIKVRWENQSSQQQFVPVFQKLFASQVASGDVQKLYNLPDKNEICVIHSNIDQYVITAHLVRPVMEESGMAGYLGVEDCDL